MACYNATHCLISNTQPSSARSKDSHVTAIDRHPGPNDGRHLPSSMVPRPATSRRRVRPSGTSEQPDHPCPLLTTLHRCHHWRPLIGVFRRRRAIGHRYYVAARGGDPRAHGRAGPVQRPGPVIWGASPYPADRGASWWTDEHPRRTAGPPGG